MMMLQTHHAATKLRKPHSRKKMTALSRERLSVIQKELADMREQFNAMKAQLGKRKELYRQSAEASRRD